MRKTFSITDERVLKKLEQVTNQSQYIQQLIIRDINDPDGNDEFKQGLLVSVDILEECLAYIRKKVE